MGHEHGSWGSQNAFPLHLYSSLPCLLYPAPSTLPPLPCPLYHVLFALPLPVVSWTHLPQLTGGVSGWAGVDGAEQER